MTPKVLKAGTVVHVYGLPVELTADVQVDTHDGTWELIVAELARATDRSGPGNARADGSYGYPRDARLSEGPGAGPKTLHNSDVSGARQNVPDIVVVGDGDSFKLLCKASSKLEGWMKSTKAMEIPGAGCLVQVTTQQGTHVAEALVFVPGVVIAKDEHGGRKLVSTNERVYTG